MCSSRIHQGSNPESWAWIASRSHVNPQAFSPPPPKKERRGSSKTLKVKSKANHKPQNMHIKRHQDPPLLSLQFETAQPRPRSVCILVDATQTPTLQKKQQPTNPPARCRSGLLGVNRRQRVYSLLAMVSLALASLCLRICAASMRSSSS